MPTRKLNTVTEREGVNYVRAVVEASNSIFKEQDLRHDYGHDAFVLLAEGERVLPKEVAMQIKSGASYCTPTTCKIPATGSQLTFWAGHDLDTLGVVYDPAEKVAYWVDLKVEAQQRLRGRREQSGAVIEFPKSEWNRLDRRMFREFVIPVLQGKPPDLDPETAIEWAGSVDIETQDLGVRVLLARYWREFDTWRRLLALFYEREPLRMTPRVVIGFAKMMGHHDDGFSMREAPTEVREYVEQEILNFGPAELAKVLSYVDDDGFERPSAGYSLMPVLAARPDCAVVFEAIRCDSRFDGEVRRIAEALLVNGERDPQFLSWWRKDRM